MARARRADGRRPDRDRRAAAATALRLPRRALVRAARDRHPGPRVPRRRARRPALRGAARGRVHRRGQLRPGRRHLLLRLDGHRPEGARRASTSRSPSCSRTAATASSSRSAATRGAELLAELAPAAAARDGGRRPPSGPPTGRPRRWAARWTPTDIRDLLLPQPRAPALGRRRRPLPDLRQLHDGLPDLLLHHGRGRRPTSTGEHAERRAALGLVLHRRLLAHPRRQRAPLRRARATASG